MIYMNGIGKQEKKRCSASINEIFYGWDIKLYAVPERTERAVAGFLERFISNL